MVAGSMSPGLAAAWCLHPPALPGTGSQARSRARHLHKGSTPGVFLSQARGPIFPWLYQLHSYKWAHLDPPIGVLQTLDMVGTALPTSLGLSHSTLYRVCFHNSDQQTQICFRATFGPQHITFWNLVCYGNSSFLTMQVKYN